MQRDLLRSATHAEYNMCCFVLQNYSQFLSFKVQKPDLQRLKTGIRWMSSALLVCFSCSETFLIQHERDIHRITDNSFFWLSDSYATLFYNVSLIWRCVHILDNSNRYVCKWKLTGVHIRCHDVIPKIWCIVTWTKYYQ